MKLVIDSEHFLRSLKRLTHEIIEKNDNINDIVLIGIKKKGYPIALEIQKYIKAFEGIDVICEGIDISSYRDDYKKTNYLTEKLNVNVDNKVVILVDDVLYTGRSVRAAMDFIIDHGRPSKIKLAVFIDRGHRELPIRADFVGKNIPTSKDELVVCDFENKQVILK
jgi:pyrimidine operon attenuation protein/uracil phosphoribosyltransferase